MRGARELLRLKLESAIMRYDSADDIQNMALVLNYNEVCAALSALNITTRNHALLAGDCIEKFFQSSEPTTQRAALKKEDTPALPGGITYVELPEDRVTFREVVITLAVSLVFLFAVLKFLELLSLHLFLS